MQSIRLFPCQDSHFTSDDSPIHVISPVCHGSHQPPTSHSIDGHFFQKRMGKRTLDQGQQSATAENQRDPKCSRIVAQGASEYPLLNRVSGLSVSRELTAPNAPVHINQRELAKQEAVMHWLNKTTIRSEVERFITLTYDKKQQTNYINLLGTALESCACPHDVDMSASLLTLSCTNLQELYKNISHHRLTSNRGAGLFRQFIRHLSHVSERLIHQQSDTWRLEDEPMKTFFAKQLALRDSPLTASEWTGFAKTLYDVSEVSYWIAQTILHGAQSIYEDARIGNVENLKSYALPQLHVQLPIQALWNAKIDQISWEDKTITIDRSTVVRCKPDFMKRLSTYINNRKTGYIFYDTQSKQHIASPSDLQRDLATASRGCLNVVHCLTLLQTAIAFADNEGSADELKKSDWLDATTVGAAFDQFAQIQTGCSNVQGSYVQSNYVDRIRAILGIFKQSNTTVSPSMSLRAFTQVDLSTLQQLIQTSRYEVSTRNTHCVLFNSFIRYLSQVSIGLIHETSQSWSRNSPLMSPILAFVPIIARPLTNTEWTLFAGALNCVCPTYYLIACTILHGARAIHEDYRQCSAQTSESWDLPYLSNHFSINKVLIAQIEGISLDKSTITFDEHTVARFPPSFMKKIHDYTERRTGGFIFIDIIGSPIHQQDVHKAFKRASRAIDKDNAVNHLTLLETAITVSDSEKDGTLLPGLFD